MVMELMEVDLGVKLITNAKSHVIKSESTMKLTTFNKHTPKWIQQPRLWKKSTKL